MLILTFYANLRGDWVGELFDNETRLLATTHPATIAAAIFAMEGYSLHVETYEGSFTMQFPFDIDERDLLGDLMQDEKMGKWMSLFCFYSHFDFANPLPCDSRPDIHFRTAVHHLPRRLVKVHPSGPKPMDFEKLLEERNRSIYYPRHWALNRTRGNSNG
ncbi:hypothetical protein ACQKRQ_09365 [Paraburkholderia sp. NPDC080076]|uniref:hypothetical protein n=1 Tax=Paraburkholderia sp. NPDC080076 TaxID=3390605 RepID=UPI003D07747F